MTTHKTNDSETKWTKGKLVVQKPRGPQHALYRKVEIVSPCPEGGEMVVVGEHTGIECLTPANAERLAACWNKLVDHPDLEQVEICPKGTLEALKAAAKLVEIARQYFPKSMHNSDKFKLEQACAAIGSILARADAKKDK